MFQHFHIVKCGLLMSPGFKELTHQVIFTCLSQYINFIFWQCIHDNNSAQLCLILYPPWSNPLKSTFTHVLSFLANTDGRGPEPLRVCRPSPHRAVLVLPTSAGSNGCVVRGIRWWGLCSHQKAFLPNRLCLFVFLYAFEWKTYRWEWGEPQSSQLHPCHSNDTFSWFKILAFLPPILFYK